jgi:hypothetical protein
MHVCVHTYNIQLTTNTAKSDVTFDVISNVMIISLTNKGYAMFYTVIKLDGQLNTGWEGILKSRAECFSNVRREPSLLASWIDSYHENKLHITQYNKTHSSDKTRFFSQSERALDCIHVIYSVRKTGSSANHSVALDYIYGIILTKRNCIL